MSSLEPEEESSLAPRGKRQRVCEGQRQDNKTKQNKTSYDKMGLIQYLKYILTTTFAFITIQCFFVFNYNSNMFLLVY